MRAHLPYGANMTDKIIVSPTTRMASLSVYIDYDNAKPTGFYQLGDSAAVRVYATGDGLSNELVHVQEFSITNQNELSGKFALDNFVIPPQTTKLTAFCVYGNRLDNGYPNNLDPEFCYDIEVVWKVTVLPKVTMNQWAYFNTKQLDQSSYVDIPEYNIPYYLSGTISPAIPFKIEAYIEKDINFYASTYTMPYPLTRDWVHPDTNGNWTVPLSPVIDGRFGGDLMDYLKSVQHARIVIKSITDDILHEQNIYYPTLFVDSGASSIPTPDGKINPIFDIGGFGDITSGVINVEENFIILGRYMEYQYTSNYTYVEYSTPTDSVLIGAVGPTVGSEPTSYGMEWASVPKNRDYIDDRGDLVNMFNNNYTHNYAFRLNGILNGNKMSITRKYKFIHPADNISIELEMLPHTRYGSIIDNHVDPLYGNVTAAINNKIVTNKVFDVNDVAPTTGDTADYYISFLTDTYLGDGFQLPYIGSPTIGSQIVKNPYNKYTMGGIEYCSVPYYDSMETNTTEISIGRFPPSPKYIQLSFTLNTAQEYTSTFNYVVAKDYEYTDLTAPYLGGSVLIVGTPSLGTINTKVKKTYTVGLPNQLSLQTMYLLGVTPTNTVQQVGAWAYGMESVESTVSAWTGIKEIFAEDGFVAGLTNTGTVLSAWKPSIASWATNNLQSATGWTGIKQLAMNSDGIVGLKEDGTVLITSSDASLSVSGWAGITQVKADGIIVGLKSDGTVVYTGAARNYANTADVDFSAVLTWAGITQIDVGPNYIVGVKSDGTVVFAGEARNGISQCQNWTGIITIAAGDFHVVGGKSNGTVVAVGGANAIGELNVDSWTGVRRVYAGIQWSVGVKDDGTVVSTFDTTLLNDAGYDPNYTNVNSWTVPL